MSTPLVQNFTVLPSNKHNRPAPPSEIKLHALDLFCPAIHILNHRFYRPPDLSAGHTPESIIEHLKSTLAETLEWIPPVAGTVKQNSVGETVIALDGSNLQGTPFTVVRRAEEFGGEDEEGLSPRREPVLAPMASTMAVKVTQFSCGTTVVASSFHHQVSDLHGFMDVLHLWAQLARGEAIDPATVPSDWDRNPMHHFPSTPSLPLTEKTPGQSYAPSGFIVRPPSEPDAPLPAYYQTKAAVTRWKLTKESYARLKRDFSLSSGAGSGDWISSGDALAALTWGSMTRARETSSIPRVTEVGRSPASSEYDTLLCAADGRDKAPAGTPLRTQLYIGNFNPLFFTRAARSDLLSTSTEASARVALAIRRALEADLSDSSLHAKTRWLEAALQAKEQVGLAADVILTNWSRFDLAGPRMDLGFGKPWRATNGGGDGYPCGYGMMTCTHENGDFYVMISIEEGAVEALRKDEVLRKYAAEASEGYIT